ncbi:MAG TPA: PorV/PorQ family protein [Gemmatimonadales bacterium]|nr:PorV/PorQ family protein [Gemmatimonadales bacterium]
MRRSRCSLWLAVLVVSPLSLPAQTTDDVVAAGAAFLLFPVGGRAAALGQAAVANTGSGEMAFWNPAGLATLRRSELGLHRANTFVSNNTILSAYVMSPDLGVIGVAGYLVDFGSQEITRPTGQPAGRISLKNLELLASYATVIANSLSVGLNYKFIQFRHDCSGDCALFPSVTGTTHGLDIGMQYGFGPTDALRLGAAVQHAGFPLQLENRDQADPLPTRVQMGAAYRVQLPRVEGTEAASVQLLVDVQEAWGSYRDPDLRVGAELTYGESVQLRGGYAWLQSESRGASIGAGFRLGRAILDFARIFYATGTFDEPVHLSLRVLL